MNRTIIHLDLDAFYVSVERKRDKRLLGKPLIVGGSSNRGVVAACSYEARYFGVHSAMPMYLAKQLCPDATVISGDMEAYSQHSHFVTEIIAASSPLFEKASIDEFYIDASGMDKFFGTGKWAVELRNKIIRESGLPISMGWSVNKMVSKVATAEFKPNATKEIAPGTEREFLRPLSVDKIPMVGKKTAAFLHDMGVRTIETLREMPLKFLCSALGKNGLSLWHKANGIDTSPVISYHEQKSISTETTFNADTMDIKNLQSICIAMVEKIAFTLREEKKLCSCITFKLRYSNFDTETCQQQIYYTSSDAVLIKTALELFKKLYKRRMLIRLIGVRLSGLVYGNHQIHLFDETVENVKLCEQMDWIKHRFGSDKVMRAITMDVSNRVKMNINAFNG